MHLAYTHLGLKTGSKAKFPILLIAAVGISTLIAIFILVHSTVNIVAAKTNRLENERSTDLVNASVESALDAMTTITNDNAKWDEAASQLYSDKLDLRWLHETWAVASSYDTPYDGSFVLDEKQNILWAHFRDKPLPASSSAFLGDGYKNLLTKHTAVLATGETAVSGITNTAAGPALISVGLVRPYEQPLSGQGQRKRYLVLTRHLTSEYIQQIGKTFRLDHLTIHEKPSPNVPYYTLRDASDNPTAHLVWVPGREGTLAASAARSRIEAISWLVGGMVCLFLAICVYVVQKLSRGEQTAKHIALTDGLSGLPNRRAMLEACSEVDTKKLALPRTVVFIDLDGFKAVNDICGHDIGDKLIRILARAFIKLAPAESILARLGGDEFALLVTGINSEDRASQFAQDVLDCVSHPLTIDGRLIRVGASIGIASLAGCEHTATELFRRADLAMYDSKSNGKGRVTIYRDELDQQQLQIKIIEAQIVSGLSNCEFDVVYQPIVSAKTHNICAVEALVRWPRRPNGSLPPDQFIPIAESSGLINELGKFVLERACTDLLGFNNLKVSVNVSPAQFRDPDFEASVESVLRSTGFPPNRLELEITEGYLVENPERASDAIRTLKGSGISFALDDFGTGYSSVGYLRQFKFDRIKIDKSLAGCVDLDAQAAALVAGTVGIASALHLEVTAEGVETEHQARLLRLAGCDHLQGFYFYRPIGLTNLIDTLNADMRVLA